VVLAGTRLAGFLDADDNGRVLGSLLSEAEKLLDKGIHPIRIAQGFEPAAALAVKHLETICDSVVFDQSNIEPLIQTASTTFDMLFFRSCR
jgi:chaperonin GroEL (HSP60 family)